MLCDHFAVLVEIVGVVLVHANEGNGLCDGHTRDCLREAVVPIDVEVEDLATKHEEHRLGQDASPLH